MKYLFSLSLTLIIFLFACDNTSSTSNSVTSGNVPVISLFEPLVDTISVGGTFNEPGYIALDAEDMDLTSAVNIWYYKNNKNTSITLDELNDEEGTFYIKYSVTDSDGNTIFAWRTVIVSENFIDDTTNTETDSLILSDPSKKYSEIDLSTYAYAYIDIQSSKEVSESDISVKITNSSGYVTTALTPDISYISGTAKITVTPLSTCPSDTYTVEVTVSVDSLSSSKSFDVYVYCYLPYDWYAKSVMYFFEFDADYNIFCYTPILDPINDCYLITTTTTDTTTDYKFAFYNPESIIGYFDKIEVKYLSNVDWELTVNEYLNGYWSYRSSVTLKGDIDSVKTAEIHSSQFELDYTDVPNYSLTESDEISFSATNSAVPSSGNENIYIKVYEIIVYR